MPFAYILDASEHKVAVLPQIIKKREFESVEKAGEILAAVERLAREMREKAQQEFETQRQRGFELGKQEGLESWAEYIAATELRAASYLSSLNTHIVSLVIDALRKLAPKLGAKALVPEMVAQAVEEAMAERFLIVRVHSGNSAAVAKRLEEIKQRNPMVEFFDLVEDDEVDEYACVVESEVGVVRASLDSQLAAIERAMKQALGAASAAA